MRKRIFKPIGIGGATALISMTSLLSYVIGLLRDRIIAINFGTSDLTDTFYASFIIPDILFNLFIAGALSAAFLPVFSDYLIKDKKQAQHIANTMLTGASLLIIVLAVLAFIFMKEIVAIAFNDASIEMKNYIINMTRILLPSAILFAISNTLGNILMSYKHFLAYAVSPILYNLGIILGVIYLREDFGIYSAAIGVIVGAVFHCLIRIIDTTVTEYKYKPELDITHPGFKKIIILMLPKSISLIAWQVNLYIYAIVGIKIIEGGLAAFNFARNIQSVAVSLFGIAFATAVFPHLTASVSNQEKDKFTAHIQKTIQRILFFTIPAMFGIIILSKPIVELILSGGVFDENSIKLTSIILLFFAVSIPFESLVHILARAFYAMQNTFTPMLINLIAMTLIACSTIFIAPAYGVKWFSLGFSLGLVLQVLLLSFFLRNHLSGFNFKIFFSSFSKTIFASLIMSVVIFYAQGLENFISPKLATTITIILGGISFFTVAAMVKCEEIWSVKYVLDRVFKKKTYENQ